ncbi:hypothetical protein, partial [Photorhabdus cinerea]|uniref:hypothetical protein n=1 Tax=Photorhabdus cinerea TaxID=471575 RepID=UPI001A991B0D
MSIKRHFAVELIKRSILLKIIIASAEERPIMRPTDRHPAEKKAGGVRQSNVNKRLTLRANSVI